MGKSSESWNPVQPDSKDNPYQRKVKSWINVWALHAHKFVHMQQQFNKFPARYYDVQFYTYYFDH